MKIKNLFLATLLLVSGSLFASAHANNINEEVPANKSSVVLTYYVYDSDDCGHTNAGMFQVRQQPSNGRVEIARRRVVLDRPGHACHGKPVNFTAVIYTPNRNYRGQDRLSVSNTREVYVSGADLAFDDFIINVTVK